MNVSYELFLIIPPGLEDLAKEEVELKCPVSDIEVIKGGLILKADIDWISEAHLRLKIPTRILMRLTEFKVSPQVNAHPMPIIMAKINN
jgi:23S rRNA G2445 N2-methylase RlmL